MSLEEMKKARDSVQMGLDEVQAGIRERTDKARELNRLNYDAIDASKKLRIDLAQHEALIRAEEQRLAESKTEDAPA